MRDAVENLAKAYIEIRQEGCIQFDDLLVVIHSDASPKIALEVCLTSVGKQMYGFKGQKTPLNHCQDLQKYLKDCLGKWRDSMNEKRRFVNTLRWVMSLKLDSLHMLSVD